MKEDRLNRSTWTTLDQLWKYSHFTPFTAISRSHVIVHFREKTPLRNQDAFIGWRENPPNHGFPEYYFDTAGDYWRLYAPGRNVLLVQERESELQNQTEAVESQGYSVTKHWQSEEIIKLIREYDAWDFVVTSDSAFRNIGGGLVQHLATHSRHISWIITFSYASSVIPENARLMSQARKEAGAVLFHQANAARDLRNYFGNSCRKGGQARTTKLQLHSADRMDVRLRE